MKHLHYLLIILALLMTSCGKSGSTAIADLEKNILQEDLAGLITLENQDGTSAKGELRIGNIAENEDTDEFSVELVVSGSDEVYQYLYYVYFDPTLLSFADVDFADLLGSSEDVISFEHTKQPGRIAIAQVRNGLQLQSVESNALFATLTLIKGPGRECMEFDVEDTGLKLRQNQQFINMDVPFTVTALDENVYEVVWEEANDGDYDHNGEVNLADLTEIGRYNTLVNYLT